MSETSSTTTTTYSRAPFSPLADPNDLLDRLEAATLEDQKAATAFRRTARSKTASDEAWGRALQRTRTAARVVADLRLRVLDDMVSWQVWGTKAVFR